ncbi:FAD-dependent oxidoreductase [Rubinisphaera margarita]|uniref:FAD-dependent oxidoreductase n=1 Tax=Rubinisphaera margarita TaxID=2909586 RepID=UPI001EE901F0|nr:FAD-dependent oxidoreductase [Rubinisphaera margarita]MCG6156462.1 FAD-dependent oxidoreductase [Rubinisphaera margarita]
MSLPSHHSFWVRDPTTGSAGLTQRFDRLADDLYTEVAIVGAGITGLSTAIELLDRGFQVSVFEASLIGAGTTGASTGHLDAHPEYGPSNLLKTLKLSVAREVVQLRLRAIDQIEQRAGSGCDFQRVPGWHYGETIRDREQLQTDCELCGQLGLETSWEENLPIRHGACGYRIKGMARIDSYAYLQDLAERVVKAGGRIFENTHVTIGGEFDRIALRAGPHAIFSDAIVCAVHSNYTNVLRLDLQLPAYQSYALVVRVKEDQPDGLFWDNRSPYYYIRRVNSSDPRLLMVGGADHRTGTNHPEESKNTLRKYVSDRFRVEEILAEWSGEYFDPADGLPFIGPIPHRDKIWLAAGFRGAGLTWGTAAATLIAAQIAGEKSDLDSHLMPGRSVLAGLPRVASELLPALASYAQRILPAPPIDRSSLAPGEGAVGLVDGHRMAICRDLDGCEHRLSPICSHLGGVVRWNQAAQTWDCPVHGGRYAADGTRLYGPPPRDLTSLSPKTTPPPG